MQKIFDGNCCLPTGISSGFLSIKKHKGNLNMFLPPITPIADLRNVHPWVKSLFFARIVPNLPLAGRLKHFLEEWKTLTKYPEVLTILKNSTQERVSQTPQMGQEQIAPIQVEIENMLNKGAIEQTENQAGDFLSNIFDLW